MKRIKLSKKDIEIISNIFIENKRPNGNKSNRLLYSEEFEIVIDFESEEETIKVLEFPSQI